MTARDVRYNGVVKIEYIESENSWFCSRVMEKFDNTDKIPSWLLEKEIKRIVVVQDTMYIVLK